MSAGPAPPASNGRSSEEARDFYQLKQRAAEYYRSNLVPQRMQQVLNSMFYDNPDDVYGHLANYFASFAKPAAISRIVGKEKLDSAGQQTVQVEVLCTIKNLEKSICFTTMSNSCCDPNYTTFDTMDKEIELKNLSVQFALEWINEPLNSLLKGLLPANQKQVDKFLSEYFQRKVEEDEEQKKKDAEVEEVPEPEQSVSTNPVPVVDKKKKPLKAKKSIAPEKPIKPREPPEIFFPGAVAIGVVSLAVAKAAVKLENTSLFLHIAALNHEKEPPVEMRMPIPMVSLLSCGKSSGGKLRLIKEVIAVPKHDLSYEQGLKMMMAFQQQITKWMFSQKSLPLAMSHLGCWEKGFERTEQPFELIHEVCDTLELTLGEDLHLILNCAAHELMDYEKEKYEIITGVLKHPDEMIELYTSLVEKYPSIIGLIDPLRKEDEEQWSKLCHLLSPQCYLLADGASRSIDKLITNGLGENRYSGLILKHANQTTISDMIRVVKLMEAQDCRFIPSLTDAETLDDSIADIAVGLGARFIKLGGLCHGERVAKYNRLLAIEEELAQRGALGQAAEHQFPVISEEEHDPNSVRPGSEQID
ncbi:enolase 4 isoform X1 [Chiloscyllium plagiosum]|uniref:enolase 4 isoform X1 n=2 Tax=Chiloscyllium plagiosum TaxID=36176 RepID=UPI001CB82E67|nr:enolase 4 isoform X1 [Chiloscyllium plagiosum]